MILLKNMTVSRGDKLLLNEASCQIDVRQKIALVGKNGCGKSSLFAVLMRQLEFTHGEVELPKKLTIAHLEQETPARQTTALDHVLAAHAVFAEIETRRRAAEAAENYELVAACYHELEEIHGFELSSKAAKLLQGLGFDDAMQQKTVAEFSGGWRMRINLARCLFKPADLLLLDEPTNYLELESIVWLERWLQQSTATIVFISHDRSFIDNVATHIIHLNQQKLQMYTGNYSQFEKLHFQQMMLQQAQFEKQQKKITHMMDFVNRFRAKASKAKQAQSRLRAIEKLELVAGIQGAGAFSFNLHPAPTVSNPVIKLDEANIGYGEKIILNEVKLSLLSGTRIGLLGVNGAGKSTLLKTLIGKLPLVSGECFISNNAKVGYFAQHQIDDLPLDESLLQHFREVFPNVREQNIRSYLGSYMFTGDQVYHPIGLFSGGEKSRIALAKLFWEPKNLIILDEPTNHLDMEMREALMLALQDFQGTLILVSHDRFLLESLVDEFYLVADHQVRRFEGDIEDYQQWYWKQQSLNEKGKNSKKNSNSKEKKVDKTLKNGDDLKKLEKEIEKTQKQINVIQDKMSSPTYFSEENKIQATTDHSQLRILQDQLGALEQQWYQLNDKQ